MSFLKDYEKAASTRVMQNLPPLALNASQVAQLIQALQSSEHETDLKKLKDLFIYQIEPGMHDAACLKAKFLSAVAQSKIHTVLFTPLQAVHCLGTMRGGANIIELVHLLKDELIAKYVCEQLSNTVFLFESYYAVLKQYKSGNPWAEVLLKHWANASWLHNKPALPHTFQAIVFKVSNSVTAQDFSPPEAAWSCKDIPLHAQTFLEQKDPKAQLTIQSLKKSGYPIIFIAQQLAIQHARPSMYQSGLNSLLWQIGEPIPYHPNRYHRGLILSETIGEPFANMGRNAGSQVMTGPTHQFETGDVVCIQPYDKVIVNKKGTNVPFEVQNNYYEMWQAQGRLPYFLGKSLSAKAIEDLKRVQTIDCVNKRAPFNTKMPYTLAQKIVGKSCGVQGIYPGEMCTPRIVTMDFLTARMSHPELESLPAVGNSVELTMEYFKPQSVSSTGIMLKPGDGMLHGWLNHMLLPDALRLSENRYTRSTVGLSFYAAPEHINFAQSVGLLPLKMPESVLIKFTGTIQPGIAIQDLTNAIFHTAVKQGLATQYYNPFQDRILEIEGLSYLEIGQASELIAASVEYKTQACVVSSSLKNMKQYIVESVQHLQWMIQNGYDRQFMLQHRLYAMQAWLDKPVLLQADQEAQYTHTLEINLEEIKEPLLASFNDIWDIKPLSTIEPMSIDDVFVGPASMSLQTYCTVGDTLKKLSGKLLSRLWISPTTKLDMQQLVRAEYYAIYGKVGARTEMPETWLCRKNSLQANKTVFTTANRYFFNQNARKGVTGYVGSAELAGLIAILGRIPTLKEYTEFFASASNI